ncbi:TetR/AcrR family transcriptional regulator C-terminal domain-containing protein [Streptomonospora nanhaiensis]|uniref:TetR/AcrR family transcriptional regulator C-terminal domain-containing protein n=1 Tax=Streptomonospora nanhaiensis TaxID=1323731 RepID=UPI0027E0FB66|nr:TetR/AcrR family transcriptional regulator C-terminal domain-containing protein [Streptomonospora nanhaiensis]
MLGVLREAGFTLAMAAHAVALIDSYVTGAVLQESDLALRPGYDHTAEFDYGLDLILDALEARRAR